jgi:4-hydroxybenzoate polyprenyltransferase
MLRSPLCVDLDKCLIKTDLFYESLIRLIVLNPVRAFACIAQLIKGKSYLKSYVANFVKISTENLPYNDDVIKLINLYKRSGQKVYLTTGTSTVYAQKISDFLGCFDGVLSTTNEYNLVGEKKLTKILELLENKSFDYIGDSIKDMPIWRMAEKSYLVSSCKKDNFVREIVFEKIFLSSSRSSIFNSIFKQIRFYQWVKNLLIIVPLLSSFTFSDVSLVFKLTFVILFFSLTASSVYIINDIIDMDSDRSHPDKKFRPLASGEVSILICFFLAMIFLFVGVTGSFYISGSVGFLFLGYFFLNILYSYYGKRVFVLDVFILCAFYMFRIYIGSASTNIIISDWLLGFAFYFFLSLGFLKRYIETSKYLKIEVNSKIEYVKSDSGYLFTFGSLSAMASSTIFALYIKEQTLKESHHQYQLLWFVFVIITFSLMRTWYIASRGGIESDPVKFVLKDKVTMYLIFFVLVIVFYIN